MAKLSGRLEVSESYSSNVEDTAIRKYNANPSRVVQYEELCNHTQEGDHQEKLDANSLVKG